MTSNKKFTLLLVGIAIVAISWVGWVSTNPSDSKAMVTFVSVYDLLEEDIQTRSKLGGIVKEGSIVISEENLLDCSFILQEGEMNLSVKYDRTRPDLFKDGAEVIVTGMYREGIFYADDLQTKCASRYEGDLREESSYKLSEIDS